MGEITMNYKDTVMSHKEKQSLILERSHLQRTNETQEDYLLRKQAELSFKAAINEVEIWINTHAIGITEYNHLGNNEGWKNLLYKWKLP